MYYLTIALFYSESYDLMRKQTQPPGMGKPGYKFTLNPDAALLTQHMLFASATLFGVGFWLRGVFVTKPPDCGAPANGALLGVFDLLENRWRYFAGSCSVLVLVLYMYTIFLVSSKFSN